MTEAGPLETSRLELLQTLDILDSAREPAFDALVQTASRVCGCPISLVSLIDVERQWFKARVGLDIEETPRDQAFCAHAIQGEGLFEIPDATQDARFADNPLVTGDARVRYYAGQPIVYDGIALGTLCVIDRVPRRLDEHQRKMLHDLSLILAELLNGRMEAILHRREAKRLQDFAALSGDWLWESDARGRCIWSSGDAAKASALFEPVADGLCFRDLDVADWGGRPVAGAGLLALLGRSDGFSDAIVATTGPEGRRYIALTAEPMGASYGRSAGFRGSARDVTDRIETEATLREREITLTKLASQLPGTIYQFRTFADGSACFPYASANFREVFEVSPDDVRADAMPALERVHRDDLPALMESVTASRASDAVWHARFRVVLPSKGLRWLHGSSVPELLADGSTLWSGYLTDVTDSQARDRELADTHRAVADAEQRMRALTDNLPALVSYIDRDQRYLYTNAHHRRVYGEAADDLIGRTMREVRGEQTYAQIEPAVLRALGGKRSTFDGTTDVDGVVRHYQGTLVPDFDRNGEVAGFYAMTFDMTRSRNAELAAAASERLLRGITDKLPAMVCFIDTAQRYRFANATYASWLGIDHDAMIGRTVAEVFGAKDFEAMEPHVLRALAGERLSYERPMTIDGREVHLLVEYAPEFDEQGRVCGAYALTTDITERHGAEARLIASEQRLRNLTDALPVLITYIDADGRMTYINETFRRWMGVRAEDLIGRNVLDAIGPGLYEQRRGYLQRCLAGEQVSFEIDSETHGAMRHLQTTYLPDFGPDGRVVGLTTVSVDVTDRIAAERRLSQLAHFDTLTELPNRLQFNNRLAELFAASPPEGRLQAVLFLDIDHFKEINDTHGHAVGDGVLKLFAQRIRHGVRSTDFVARLAGDEFVVVLDDLGQVDEAKRVARKIVRAVNEPFFVDGKRLWITTSIGIAVRDAEAPSAVVLLGKADQALYRAKEAGRNTFRTAA